MPVRRYCTQRRALIPIKVDGGRGRKSEKGCAEGVRSRERERKRERRRKEGSNEKRSTRYIEFPLGTTTTALGLSTIDAWPLVPMENAAVKKKRKKRKKMNLTFTDVSRAWLISDDRPSCYCIREHSDVGQTNDNSIGTDIMLFTIKRACCYVERNDWLMILMQ